MTTTPEDGIPSPGQGGRERLKVDGEVNPGLARLPFVQLQYRRHAPVTWLPHGFHEQV